MDLQETVHTIAELAVTLAGFSGVVIVFTATRRGWGSNEIVSLAAMLRASFTAMFLSFVPIIVWELGFHDSVWRITAGVIGLAQGINVCIFIWQSGWTTATFSQRLNTVIGSASVMLQVSAAAGWFPWPAVAVLIGLLWTLFIAYTNFILLLNRGVEDEPEA